MLLDTKSSSYLCYYFYTNENHIKMSLLKVLYRILTDLLLFSVEDIMQEPYLSIGLEYTSEGWLYGISEILRGKVDDNELVYIAVECLHLMVNKNEWMRNWALFDIYPILCYLLKANGKDMTLIRSEVTDTLTLCGRVRPEVVEGMVNLRMPHTNLIPGRCMFLCIHIYVSSMCMYEVCYVLRLFYPF